MMRRDLLRVLWARIDWILIAIGLVGLLALEWFGRGGSAALEMLLVVVGGSLFAWLTLFVLERFFAIKRPRIVVIGAASALFIMLVLSMTLGRHSLERYSLHGVPSARDEVYHSGGLDEPSYNEEMDRELKRAVNQLTPGRIAYNPKLAMKQGIEETVTVRISDDPHAELTHGFATTPIVERLRISGAMSAYLSGDKDDFEIVALSSDDQPVAGTYTDWFWQVTPLRRGTHKLHLRVTARIWLSNLHIETKDLLVKDTVISVAVRPWFVVRRFFTSYWQWIIGSPIVLGAIAWVWKKISARRRHPIGF